MISQIHDCFVRYIYPKSYLPVLSRFPIMPGENIHICIHPFVNTSPEVEVINNLSGISIVPL